MTRTQKALDELNAAVAQGAELPDVIGRIARRNRVNHEKLLKAYDDHCINETMNDFNYVGSRHHY